MMNNEQHKKISKVLIMAALRVAVSAAAGSAP
jgi:hypothetical protein